MPQYFPPDKEINLLHADAEKMYRRLIETVKSGIYMADAKGILFYVNQAFVEMMGYNSKDEVIGLNLADELYIDAKERDAFLAKMREKGFVRDYEVKNKRKDGSIVILSATSNFIKNDKGKIIGIEGVVTDVTEHKKLQRALVAEKQKLEQILTFDEKINAVRKYDTLIDTIVEMTSTILEAKKCSLMIYDADNNELCIQGAKGLDEEIIKTTRVKVGEEISGVVALEGQPLLVENIEYHDRFKRGSRSSYLGRSFMIAPIELEEKLFGVINVADKSTSEHLEQKFTPIDLKILCAITREVAVALENVKLYKELSFLTITDPLTHIYNYRHFSKSLEQEIKRFRRTGCHICIIMMDIDEFKTYNDTFGHLEGDALLRTIGDILKEKLRETDIICRYAGDEFAVILPDTNLEGAKVVAEKIRTAVASQPFKRPVSVSQGVAYYVADMTQRDLVQKADRALYQAKQDGKNRVCTLQ